MMTGGILQLIMGNRTNAYNNSLTVAIKNTTIMQCMKPIVL